MGQKTIKFKCHSCGHCCTDVVCLPTPWDVLRVAINTGKNPYDFLEFLTPEEINGVEKSDPTWLEVNGERYMMAMQRDEDVGCFFLDRTTKFCSIYEHRPILCRLYPFKLHETKDDKFKSFTLHKDVGCPRHRDGIYECKPLYDLYLHDKMHQEDYVRLVEKFNKNKKKKRKPEDFLKLFIKLVVA